MKPRWWALAIAVLVNSSIALAQNKGDDGYYYYPASVALLKAMDENIPPDQNMLLKVGACHGVIHGVFGMYPLYSSEAAFCPPAGATTDTAIRVVVSWLEQNPQHMPRQFLAIVHGALQKAWPCAGAPRK